ncbi:Lrp/AsnC ligand binding domain-containing protein, partial [Salmonella enterica subsp. enterica serovar Virginia]|nr:Lrp/AsnC ligand binding domain-containing protein [Salmonella enterica subsp. enterica serovar Virginia]
VSGDFDYLLKTRVPDMSAYRKLLGETLLRLPGVNDTRTYVVIQFELCYSGDLLGGWTIPLQRSVEDELNQNDTRWRQLFSWDE